MRTLRLNGALQTVRRQVSAVAFISNEDVTIKEKLGETLRALSQRLSSLEGLSVPESTEFEVAVAASGSVSLAHNFNSAVRWWVTDWTSIQGAAATTAAPALVRSSSSTANTLVLNSTVAGKAVIRVEPVQAGLTY